MVMPAKVVAVGEPEDAPLPPPIVILGSSPREVSLVGAMIGRNPGAFEFPQLNLFISDTLEGMFKAIPDPRQTHVHGLLRALAYVYGSEQTINSIAMARRWMLRRLSWPTSRIFDELRTRIAPRRMVEKSAIYSQDTKCLERLRKASPDAYYVRIVEPAPRSGAVSASADGNKGPLDTRDQQTVLREHLQVRKAERFISEAMKNITAEKLVILQIERLLADPRNELTQLCTRLQLPNDEAAVTKMLHPEQSPFASFGPVGANLGDDPAFLRDPSVPLLNGPRTDVVTRD